MLWNLRWITVDNYLWKCNIDKSFGKTLRALLDYGRTTSVYILIQYLFSTYQVLNIVLHSRAVSCSCSGSQLLAHRDLPSFCQGRQALSLHNSPSCILVLLWRCSWSQCLLSPQWQAFDSGRANHSIGYSDKLVDESVTHWGLICGCLGRQICCPLELMHWDHIIH